MGGQRVGSQAGVEPAERVPDRGPGDAVPAAVVAQHVAPAAGPGLATVGATTPGDRPGAGDQRDPRRRTGGGEQHALLSRVTNDIDNISQALQQTLSQLLTSLLTVIGVVIMMFVVSPVLALIALVTIPISVLVTGVIGKRAQKQFVAQWRTTGEQRPHRGGLHRPVAGQGLRSQSRGGGGIPAAQRGSLQPRSPRSSSPA